MGVPTFTRISAPTVNPTWTLPAGLADGDELWLWIQSDTESPGIVTGPLGYTLKSTWPRNGGADGGYYWLYTKRASAEAVGPTFSTTNNTEVTGTLVRIPSTDVVTPINQEVSTESLAGNASPWDITSGAFAAPTNVVTTDIFFVASDNKPGGTVAHGTPAGWTKLDDNSDGAFLQYAVFYRTGTAAGFTGAVTSVGTAPGLTASWFAHVVSFKEVAGGGGGGTPPKAAVRGARRRESPATERPRRRRGLVLKALRSVVSAQGLAAMPALGTVTSTAAGMIAAAALATLPSLGTVSSAAALFGKAQATAALPPLSVVSATAQANGRPLRSVTITRKVSGRKRAEPPPQKHRIIVNMAIGAPSSGLSASGVAALPQLTAVGAGVQLEQAQATAALPPLSVVAAAVQTETAQALAALPPLSSVAVAGLLAQANATAALPPLSSVITAVTGGGAIVFASLPPLATALSTGAVLVQVQALAALPPLLSLADASAGGITAQALAVLPALYALASASNSTVDLLEGPSVLEFIFELGTLQFVEEGKLVAGALKRRHGDNTPFFFRIGVGQKGEDLTNAVSIKLTVRKIGKTPVIDNRDATRVAPFESGMASYQPTPGEIAALLRGKYLASVVTTFTDTQKREYPTETFAEVIVGRALTEAP